MTALVIILIAIIWISYGAFNSWQHEWFESYKVPPLNVLFNILLAPIALVIRIFRGVFFWDGNY